jgi:hypothetical protein
MKKSLFILAITFAFNSFDSLAQLADGQHTFVNQNITLTLVMTDDGSTIASASVTNKITKKTSTGKGSYRTANNVEWYEFQTNDCNYDFDVTGNKLTLSQFDCKNGGKSAKYTLIKK